LKRLVLLLPTFKITMENFNSLQIFIIAIFSLGLIVNIFYWAFFYLRLNLAKEKKVSVNASEGVSIVIAAKNEAENLTEFLPWIITQNYPNFEIIVVDDASWDDTQVVLEAFKAETDKLKVISLNDEVHKKTGKKFAVTLGIKAAKYNTILLTDADCKPATEFWVQEIMNAYNSPKTQVVLGFGWVEPRGSALLKLINYFDTFLTAARYLSFANAKIPYMGVGRNLSYKKDLFFKVGGFRKHYQLASGDDDLFVNEVAFGGNTNICINTKAHTISKGPETFKKFWRQKRRHFTTGVHYKKTHKLLLFTEAFSFFLLLIGLTLSFIEGFHFLVFFLVFFTRGLLYSLNFVVLVKKLKIKNLALLFPIIEPLNYVFQLSVLVANKLNKPKVWR
jgi:glycosyltransferase involved in cell wall biosynthesis